MGSRWSCPNPQIQNSSGHGLMGALMALALTSASIAASTQALTTAAKALRRGHGIQRFNKKTALIKAGLDSPAVCTDGTFLNSATLDSNLLGEYQSLTEGFDNKPFKAQLADKSVSVGPNTNLGHEVALSLRLDKKFSQVDRVYFATLNIRDVLTGPLNLRAMDFKIGVELTLTHQIKAACTQIQQLPAMVVTTLSAEGPLDLLPELKVASAPALPGEAVWSEVDISDVYYEKIEAGVTSKVAAYPSIIELTTACSHTDNYTYALVFTKNDGSTKVVDGLCTVAQWSVFWMPLPRDLKSIRLRAERRPTADSGYDVDNDVRLHARLKR